MRSRSTARYVDEPGEFPGQCAAARRSDGQRCRRLAVAGRHVCHLHGGRSPSGAAHGRFTTGRHVRVGRYDVPERWREMYERLVEERSAIIESYEEMSLIVARIQELTESLEGDDPAAIGAAVFRAFDTFMAAQASGSNARIRETFDVLARELERARSHHAAYDEMWRLIDLLRRVRAGEVRRIATQQEMMTAEQARVYLSVVHAAVADAFDEVADPEERQRLKRVFADRVRRDLALPAGA